MQPSDWIALAAVLSTLIVAIASLFAAQLGRRADQRHQVEMAEKAADEVRRRTLHDQRIQLYGDALNKMMYIERVDGEDADVLIRRVVVLASSPFLSAFFGWYGDLLMIADGSLTEAEKTQAQTRIEKHQATALEVARLEAQGRFNLDPPMGSVRR